MIAADVARWAFWTRGRLLPWTPGRVRVAARGLTALRTRRRRRLLREELERTFEHAGEEVALRSDALWTRCMLEELVLQDLDGASVGSWVEPVDPSLLRNPSGTVLVFPHAGNVMMLLAAVAFSGVEVVQVAARGFHPRHRPGRWEVLARRAREAAEDRLPCTFHPVDRSPRELVRVLARGGVVAVTLDGRGGRSFFETPYLGRRARLPFGPWKLAERTGASLVPAVCVSEDGRPWRVLLGAPVMGTALQRAETALRGHVEPLLRAHPDHYGRWLLHCRLVGDRPLFVDA